MRNAHRLALATTLTSLALGCGGERGAAAAPVVMTEPMTLVVDARESSRGRIKSHLVIPAHPGELALVYPKWIPGEHGPNGPITDLAALKITAGAASLPWRRNPDDMYEIDVTVPAGATSVEVELEGIRSAAGNFGGSAAASARYVDVVWNQAVLYPKGALAAGVLVDASIRLPRNWTFATALPRSTAQGDAIAFRRVSLEMLVDSPLLAGQHMKTYDLGVERGANHSLVVVGENAESLIAPEEEVLGWRKLVVEANALFGARHYESYRFLLLASDVVPWFGLEHHQSSEDYVKEHALTDGDLRRVFGELLPHEYVHSWNGKYRRPKGLATATFQEPMRGELLWIYEGLTEYLGWVLSARSGLATLDDAKASLGLSAIQVDTPGRAWRPLADTAVAAQLLYNASSNGSSLRRSVDFYAEGLLIWLEADVIIRQKTNGARSLDDFCQRFHGGRDGVAEVKPYELDEVIKTLDAVVHHDWKGFFDERVYQVAPRVPLAGLEGAGYKLGRSEKKPELLGLFEKAYKFTSLRDTLGFTLNEDNIVSDVVDGSPASKGGLTAKVKLLGVDSRKMTTETMSEALVRAKTGAAPIELLVEGEGFYRTVKIDYHGGETYRVLERDPSKPDLLASILAPKVSPPK